MVFFCIKKFQNALFKPLSGLEKKRQWAPNYIKNIKLTKIALHIHKNSSVGETEPPTLFCIVDKQSLIIYNGVNNESLHY